MFSESLDTSGFLSDDESMEGRDKDGQGSDQEDAEASDAEGNDSSELVESTFAASATTEENGKVGHVRAFTGGVVLLSIFGEGEAFINTLPSFVLFIVVGQAVVPPLSDVGDRESDDDGFAVTTSTVDGDVDNRRDDDFSVCGSGTWADICTGRADDDDNSAVGRVDNDGTV